MPRTALSTEAGTVNHVLNRGNGRTRLFHKDGECEPFERVLTEGLNRYPGVQLGLQFTLRGLDRPPKTRNNQ